MTNTYKHAKTELDVLLKCSPESELANFKDEMLMLLDKFGHSGQSGGSAPFVAKLIGDTITKLCLHEPLSPINGTDDEWFDVGEGLKQNSRCSALFKQGDNNPHYLDAIVFKEPNGCAFTGKVKSKLGEVASVQSIKSFPFTPKTFYINVVMINNQWEVKDVNQLSKVFKYYNK